MRASFFGSRFGPLFFLQGIRYTLEHCYRAVRIPSNIVDEESPSPAYTHSKHLESNLKGTTSYGLHNVPTYDHFCTSEDISLT